MIAQVELSLGSVVHFMIYLIVAALVFGLFFWLLTYVEATWPTVVPFMKIARVILVILAVLVLIGILLSFIGHPVFVLK